MNQSNGVKASNAQSDILVADGLRKVYGTRVALHGLTFKLKAGRVLGFLGPNGAGKTTSIRMLTTMLEPTSGYFAVDGITSDHPQEIRRKIGVLPEGLGFPKHITGIDYLAFFGQLYGRTVVEAKTTGQRLLNDVGMQHRGDALVGTYSHGMRQRLGIARALVNDPRVVFLDEPTLGLDPRGQAELLTLIRRIAVERNTGVVLCSHLLSEIEGICDDVIIMNSGQMVAHGTVAEVIGQTPLDTAQRNAIRIRVAASDVARTQQVLSALPGIKQVALSDTTGNWLSVELENRELAGVANGKNGSKDSGEDLLVRNKILAALIQADIPVRGFEAAGGRLQDVFLQLTAESIG